MAGAMATEAQDVHMTNESNRFVDMFMAVADLAQS